MSHQVRFLNLYTTNFYRWWFQTYFMFTSTWGNDQLEFRLVWNLGPWEELLLLLQAGDVGELIEGKSLPSIPSTVFFPVIPLLNFLGGEKRCYDSWFYSKTNKNLQPNKNLAVGGVADAIQLRNPTNKLPKSHCKHHGKWKGVVMTYDLCPWIFQGFKEPSHIPLAPKKSWFPIGVH